MQISRFTLYTEKKTNDIETFREKIYRKQTDANEASSWRAEETHKGFFWNRPAWPLLEKRVQSTPVRVSEDEHADFDHLTASGTIMHAGIR